MDGKSNGIVSILEKQGRKAPSGKPPDGGDSEVDNEYTAYANGRVGTRPQLSIVFRKADGSAKAFAYSHLYSIETADPNLGFALELTQTKVTIKGRNLSRLFFFVCEHRAAEVIEAERNQVFSAADADPVVETIEFSPLPMSK
jgi:hypothetical protein